MAGAIFFILRILGTVLLAVLVLVLIILLIVLFVPVRYSFGGDERRFSGRRGQLADGAGQGKGLL